MIIAIVIAYSIAEVYYMDFVVEVEKVLQRLLRFPIRIPKPFSCRECMTFWTCLFWLLHCGCYWAYAIAFALLCMYIGSALLGIRVYIYDKFFKKIAE